MKHRIKTLFVAGLLMLGTSGAACAQNSALNLNGLLGGGDNGGLVGTLLQVPTNLLNVPGAATNILSGLSVDGLLITANNRVNGLSVDGTLGTVFGLTDNLLGNSLPELLPILVGDGGALTGDNGLPIVGGLLGGEAGIPVIGGLLGDDSGIGLPLIGDLLEGDGSIPVVGAILGSDNGLPIIGGLLAGAGMVVGNSQSLAVSELPIPARELDASSLFALTHGVTLNGL